MKEDKLISFEEAIDSVLESVRPLPVFEVSLQNVFGLFLARPVLAPEDSPAAPISAMDGYAVPRAIFEQLVKNGKASARVIGEILAGRPGFEEEPKGDEVVRIFTGGVVPSWAMAVIKQEDTKLMDGTVVFACRPKEHQYIRDKGSDVRRGDVVIAEGEQATPQAVGLLFALGIQNVLVRPKPRIGIVVTGSEVVASGMLNHGQIRDSNGPALETMAFALGAKEVLRDNAPDDVDAIKNAIQKLLGKVDLLVTTGGVSVGKYDMMRDVLESIGFRRIFWRVAQRPGMPIFAGERDGLVVLGLPGNPASALASFLCYGWPAMRRLQGARNERVRLKAIMKEPARKHRGFTAMLRAKRSYEGATIFVETTGPQESHQLLPFVQADCLILGSPDKEVLERGFEVEIVPFPWAV
jgi:molybdopterin molybdotransferase